MKHAYVFPGQGAQAVGMGKDLYDNVPAAKELFEKANEILGFRITDIMFAGTDEELKQTRVTQPAVFLHSVIMAKALGVKPDAAAGHSLGEFSALVVAGALSFEDGLKLVSKRAMAMQAACAARNDGRHSRSGRQGRGGDLRVGRRRGRRRQLQLPGPAGDLGSRGGRRRRLRESQGRRSAPCAAPAGGRSVPLAADGACQAGT